MVKLCVCSLVLCISCTLAAGSRGLIRLVFEPFVETRGDTVFLHHVSFYHVTGCQYSVHGSLGHWWLQMVVLCDLFFIYLLGHFLKRCFPSLLFGYSVTRLLEGMQNMWNFLYYQDEKLVPYQPPEVTN